MVTMNATSAKIHKLKNNKIVCSMRDESLHEMFGAEKEEEEVDDESKNVKICISAE